MNVIFYYTDVVHFQTRKKGELLLQKAELFQCCSHTDSLTNICILLFGHFLLSDNKIGMKHFRKYYLLG